MQNQVTAKKLKAILAVLASIQFCHILDFMLMMPLGPQLMRSFSISPEQFGLLVSSYTFAAGVMGVLGALFLDRLNRKTGLIFFLSGFTVCTFICGWAQTYEQLLFMRTITGLFGGLLGPLTLSIMADLVPIEQRGRAMGTLTMGFGLASVLGVPFSVLLASSVNWRFPFYVLAALSLMVVVTSIKLLPSLKEHLKLKKSYSISESLSPYREALTIASQRTALCFISLVVLGQFTIITFLSPSMVANVGFSENQLGLIYLLGGIVTVFASPRIGKMADRYGRIRVFQVSALLSLLPILIITHLGVTSVAAALCITSFFFVTINGRMISAMATMTSVVAPHKRGTFMSLTNSVQSFSSATAAYIAGKIVTKSAEGHLIHYDRAGFLAAAFTVCAFLLSSKLKSLQTDPK